MNTEGRIRVQSKNGFALVELMVALVLGVLVIAAIGSVYVGSKRTSTARDAMSLLQENGRIALRHLHNGLSRAGYADGLAIDPFIHCDADSADEVMITSDGGPYTLEDCRNGSADVITTLGDYQNDVISVSFIPDGKGYQTDCLGIDAIARKSDGRPSTVVVAGQERVVNTYFVDNNILKCRGSSTTQPLAEGISAMQAVYLYNNDDQFYWLNATQVYNGINGASWEQITAVRIALVVSSLSLSRDLASSLSFKLFDQEFDTANDKQAYRVFTTTIMLRNQGKTLDDS